MLWKKVPDAAREWAGDVSPKTLYAAKVMDDRIKRVSRTDAATGGLQPRSAGGRSY
jgi:hypothetical protein